ncbi:universal stress protein [Streptosporangium sp. NPDC048047]|uniref:universal stress protein n=1 Tax=Streptosporangium sp. NPDC048047 TaxID=3155748 RepID=UPI0034395E12
MTSGARHVLAVVHDPGAEAAVVDAAGAVATLLGADVRAFRLAAESGAGETVAAVLHELERPDVLAGVLAGDGGARSGTWAVVRRAGKPVVLLPPRRPVAAPPAAGPAAGPAAARRVISRVLLPLDGSAEAAAAVTGAAGLFARTGADLVVLHVFDEATVPRFWDQAAHERRAWEEEFLARHCAHPGVRMELRSGVAGEQVVDVAATEHVDLIALGWSQRAEAGRARTVRRTVAGAGVPVMLIPVPRP